MMMTTHVTWNSIYQYSNMEREQEQNGGWLRIIGSILFRGQEITLFSNVFKPAKMLWRILGVALGGGGGWKGRKAADV
jgi:hypothetical protein